MSAAELMRKDLTEQAALVRSREVSALELVDAAIARLEGARELNVLVHEQFEAARETATGPLGDGPLAGVPFLLKDLAEPQAGLPERMGSRALRDHVADETAWSVERYRAAGLIICGRTNTPGVRQSLCHRAVAVRADAEPVERGCLPRRIQWRLGGRSGGRSCRRGIGRRRHRLDPDAVFVLRSRWAKATPRAQLARDRQPGRRSMAWSTSTH